MKENIFNYGKKSRIMYFSNQLTVRPINLKILSINYIIVLASFEKVAEWVQPILRKYGENYFTYSSAGNISLNDFVLEWRKKKS